MDIGTLVNDMKAKGLFTATGQLPGLTIGLPGRNYLGATVLPVKIVPENLYRETGISYRTMMANTGTRYSPTVIEGGAMIGDMLVELGEVDRASEFTAADYDALVKLLGTQSGTLEGQAQLLEWSLKTLSLPIQERIEKQRWEAIDDASVVRAGANGYTETVAYPNPSGHRVTGPNLTDQAVDPLEVLFIQQQLLADKGYSVGRFITSTRVAGLMTRHAKVRAAIGGEGATVPVRVTRDLLNAYLAENGLPGIEVYDLTARTPAGTTVRFKRENAFTIIAQTGVNAQIDLPDELRLLPDVIGYAAIGRAAGQPSSGIVTDVEVQTKKPIGLRGESYATTAPVLTSPESVAVVNYVLA